MAGTIKHRHQTALAAGSADVDRNEWNDSLVAAGGSDGQVMTRDAASADGWLWATPAAVPPAGPLGSAFYQPATNTLFSTTSTSWADVDAVNLAVSFTVPASGAVIVRLCAYCDVSTNTQQYFWAVREALVNVTGSGGLATRSSDGFTVALSFKISGLVAAAAKTWKWAHGVSGGATGRLGAGAGVSASTVSTSTAMPGALMEVWSA